MKSLTKIESILLLIFFLTIPFILFTQESEKEKKVRIKTVQKVDGKTIQKDTSFRLGADDDVEKIVKSFTTDASGDSSATVMVDVTVDSDEGIEWRGPAKKVIILKDGEEEVIYLPHGSDSRVVEYKSGKGDEEKVIIVSPGGKRKVIKWKSEDGETYDFDFDYDIDMDELNEEMSRLQHEMQELQMEILDEQGQLHEELIELKHLEQLEKLKDMEVLVVPPSPRKPYLHEDFHWKPRGGMEVTDKELRDAGIKNKPDRLDLDDIDVTKEDGVVDLAFTMAGEGNPRVEVYNIYGDKVFNGKPELMNDKYQIRMDLSKKQYGTYYMQIISGSSSKTLRLRL